ncbi:PREDICTED: putative methyltransferase At1g22800 [Camelina sativa]|uniref:Methyltransferase At1g22800 n=1 Tax=Camelina sativa TaxID=90675 RepID=A0ABM0YC28_CAMSA|nr:PREDICTED: putative methyltransferase At1g22800 [Camelina sativa]
MKEDQTEKSTVSSSNQTQTLVRRFPGEAKNQREMRRINSIYGRIGLLRRVSEKSTKQSHTFLASHSFSTHGGYGGDGELQQNNSKVKIFDRDLKRIHRDRAAWLSSRQKNNSFVDAVADNLLDRLEDCKKTFPTALCLGGSVGAVKRLIRGRGGIEKLIMMDTSYDMIKSCRDADEGSLDNSIETSYLVGDEEFLPIKESSVDLIISSLGLHWTNDLPGSMIQCKLALKPDGLFLAAILGGETLKELRIACTLAHMEREGGISPRLSPLAQVRDAGNLLTRAGFSLPGVDVDEYVVKYKSALDLIEHLRAMGETNGLLERNKILNRETALATAAIYDSMFATEDGTIPATFQVIYMTGWREHSSHQQAKRRGSATVSFRDLHKKFGGQSES